MKISSGKYDLLYSGTIIGIESEPIKFEFPESEGSLILVFKFVHNSGEDTKIEYTYPTPKTLEVKIPYANDSGNIKILRLGTLNGRDLHLNFRLFTLSDLSPTFHYNLYLGEEIPNA